MIRIARWAAAAGMALLTACGSPGFTASVHADKYLAPAMRTPLASAPASYLGVYEPGVPRTYQQVQRFTTVAGQSPNLVLYYSSWGEAFRTSFANQALARGAVPLVQIDPGTTSLQAIAAGRYDSYLRSYAARVRAFGRPVVIGFAREMNGWWYPWSGAHVAARTWIAAWRHIVTVFRQRGADNVTWQWTINNLVSGIGPPRRWWPGAAYVTWVGIDGYYYNRSDNFENVFGLTTTAVRKFTAKPILVSEVGIAPQADPGAQIPALFAGIRQRHLIGLVWFDAPARRDWRLENNPVALGAFRRDAQRIQLFRW
jgi:mannan endo-1,4-beta-mannosidase